MVSPFVRRDYHDHEPEPISGPARRRLGSVPDVRVGVVTGSFSEGVAMSRFLGPGPVLLYEAMTASRRWQGYALRAFLILSLLVALWVAWFTLRQRYQNWQNPPDMNRYMVELGEQSYYGVAGVLLTLVLLAAPAATAGAVCLDRERG